MTAHAAQAPGGTVFRIVATATYVPANMSQVETVSSNLVTFSVAPVEAINLTQDQALVMPPGAQFTLSHQLTNTGNVKSSYKLGWTNGGANCPTAASVQLAGLKLVKDTNSNGVADPSEPSLALNTVGALTLVPGESATLLALGTVPVVAAGNGNAPAYAVGGAVDTALCGDALLSAMQARGIGLPQGRTAGAPDRYVYPDKQGIPHELRVCMRTVAWTLPGATAGSFQNAPRHVLQLTGLTPEAAASFDVMTDGALDASAGEFRQQGREAGLGLADAAWSANETATLDDVAEGESAELAAYLLVGR